MPAALLLALLALGPLLWADSQGRSEAPSYSAAGIVNSADNRAGALAPNTIATLYGANLTYAVRAVSGEDIRAGVLPTVLPGTGLRVLVGPLLAQLYYVSPTQVNFLVPANLLPGPVTVQITLNGIAGPIIPLQLTPASPALYQADANTAIAAHADGSVLTADAPGRPGEQIVLYATGLGQTDPAVVPGEVARSAAVLRRLSEFQVVLDGTPLDSARVSYAGLTPGFAGLYQINVKLPDNPGPDPEIRIGLAETLSRPGLHVLVRP